MQIPALLSSAQLLTLMRFIQEARHIVLCAHRFPDGDALGSSLGLADYLRSLKKDVQVVMPNNYADFLRWMPGIKSVMLYEERPVEAAELIHKADLVFMLDFSEMSRLQDMATAFEGIKAKRVMLDHHLNPDPNMADLMVSVPEACSTSEIVFRVISELGGYDALSRSGAACLYTGMMTDTGGFTYASTRPEIYQIICELLRKGIDKDRIYRHVFHNYSPHRLQFVGYVLSQKTQFYEHNRAAIMTITREEMKRYKYLRGDAEGLVNMPLQVKGLRVVISLREDTEKEAVRVSLRSVDDFPCNVMAAQFFNGGGHRNASGGELPFPLEEAVRTAEKAIECFKDKL